MSSFFMPPTQFPVTMPPAGNITPYIPVTGAGANTGASSLGSLFTAPTASRTLGTLGRFGRVGGASLAPTLGLMGAGVIDRAFQGNAPAEQAAQGGAIGAGLGAGAALGAGGSIAGIGALPLAGIGAAGVAAGVGTHALLESIFGKQGSDVDPVKLGPVSQLFEMYERANEAGAVIPESVYEEAARTYRVLSSMGEQDEDGKPTDETKASALNAAKQVIAEAALNPQAQGGFGQPSAADLMALQQQAAEIFQPIIDDTRASGAAYAQAVNSLVPDLPAAFQPIAQLGIAREMAGANRLANAYQAQAQLLPVADRLTRYQQDIDNLAAQQFQQIIAAGMQGVGGGGFGGMGGQTDLGALLTQAG